ncbi:MAG: DUF4149 domain-containing protein [Candidatus Heimdallarchaeota archaeon]
MADPTLLWIMTLVNWLHLLATVVWIGGVIVNVAIVMPSAKEALDPPTMGKLIGTFMKRFRPIIYGCAVVLVITGIPMMTQNTEYEDIGNFENVWTIVMLVKHLLVALMIFVAVYAFETLAPQAGELAAQGPSTELTAIQKRQMRVGMIGLILGLIVLLLTGAATAITSVE